ncbi:MAG TPA: response regulator [Candidatus Acidoferrales bacterium]|jgi:two-component system chemotaxis family response regulator WspR|nr:response regulator [Candidatus Acidoferrales bacterium]
MNTENPPESGPQRTATSRRIVVLLVDDRPMTGELIRRLLVNEPCIELHYCQSAWDAIKKAKEIRPTVILQDLVMPDINGLTMVRRYRETPETKDTPVIILTTKEDPIFVQDALKAGANDYLVKVPNRADLVACLQKHAWLPAPEASPAPPAE